MKSLFSFILFSIVSLFLSPAYARVENNLVNPKLSPSALSQVRVQMMQSIGDPMMLQESESVAFSSITTDKVKGYKDRRAAFFRSLLLPGAGEYYLGKRNLAKAFFATEISLWLSYFAFQQYGQWVRQDALAFAATHSGAAIDGKPSQFFIDIGNYTDIYQYNDAKLRYGEYEKYYTEEDYFWSWDFVSNQKKFEAMRIASDRARNRSTYVLGAVFANHLISAIHATWQAVRHNKKMNKLARSQVQINFSANYFTRGLSLQIQKEF